MNTGKDRDTQTALSILGIALLTAVVFATTACSSTGNRGAPAGYRADTTPTHNGAAWVGGPQPAASRSAVGVYAKQGGAEVHIDVLGIRGYKPAAWVQNRPTVTKHFTPLLKPVGWVLDAPLAVLTYTGDYGAYMIKDHPWQALLVTAIGAEASTGALSDAWDKVAGDDKGSVSVASEAGPDGTSGSGSAPGDHDSEQESEYTEEYDENGVLRKKTSRTTTRTGKRK